MAGISVLATALNEWLSSDGLIADYLPAGDKPPLRTKSEASLVCAVLDKAWNSLVRSRNNRDAQNLDEAIALMQTVDTVEATNTLLLHGLPRLRSLVKQRLAQPDDPALPALFALKVIALYQQPEDVALILGAARAPLEPESYLWTAVFYALHGENACTPALICGLSDPLPVGFIRVAFLDSCNALARKGLLAEHPFASAEGISQLQRWLASADKDEQTFAVSACGAVPFLPSPAQKPLLELAASHHFAHVRVEAAWAGAKLGIAGSTEKLIKFTRLPCYSGLAQEYLAQFGMGDRVPADVHMPDFLALVEMSEWLAHPHEYGRPPDWIEQVDTRELLWPPTRDRRQLWVFRYRYVDDDGDMMDDCYGLVGSITWSMLDYSKGSGSIEDVYAQHCAWELIHNEDTEAPPQVQVSTGKRILQKYNPRFGRPGLQILGSPAKE
jgi:hypothetical protein